jgi:glycine cleavage system H lipoate-binding protein
MRLEADVGQIVSTVMTGCRLDFARWYGGDGVWVSSPDAPEARPGEVEVGLVGCIWRILQPVREVVAPRSGVSFAAGETCGWLLRSERAIPIRIPVGGTVTEVNESVVAEVGDCGRLDGPDNWLFRVRSAVRPEEVPRLFRGEDALIWHLRRLRILKGHLRSALEAGQPGVGIVMADGGALETNLETVLGTDRYGAMIDALF